MRFKKKTRPKCGEERVVTYFAYLPVTTLNDKEWRWLQKVTILQRYLCVSGERFWGNIYFK